MVGGHKRTAVSQLGCLVRKQKVSIQLWRLEEQGTLWKREPKASVSKVVFCVVSCLFHNLYCGLLISSCRVPETTPRLLINKEKCGQEVTWGNLFFRTF